MVVSTARRVSSHFDGSTSSARLSLSSQSSELVVGGGLHFMEPLRSTRNNKFEGKSDDGSLYFAQLPSNSASALSCGLGTTVWARVEASAVAASRAACAGGATGSGLSALRGPSIAQPASWHRHAATSARIIGPRP